MIESPGIAMTLISFLLVIGPLVFVHEFGHYIAGRAFGVKADVFSIGFGREIFGWNDRRGTRWKVGWLPLGGYVRFAGDMNPASRPDAAWDRLPPELKAQTFQSKTLWQRFIIVLAGPAANFLVAIGIFAAFFAVYGEPRTPAVVAVVEQGSAAAQAGLRPGDRIVAIDGGAIERFEDIAKVVSIRPGEPMVISFERDGRVASVEATPSALQERDRFGNEFKRGLLGIGPADRIVVPLGPHEVLGAAVRHTRDVIRMMVDTLGQVITGRRSVKELGGPIKIAQYSGQQATLGLVALVEFIAIISINLGFINLLPIPLLDGGHLLFYAVEAIRRRPLSPVVQDWAFRSGLALLLGAMLFVTLNDIVSIGFIEHLAGLIGRS